MKESFIKVQLSGRLAERLSLHSPRVTKAVKLGVKSRGEPLVVDDMPSKLVLAMSLLLTSHLVHYAQSGFSETRLIELRDALLSEFSAADNVGLEVEVYDLLNWFASAIDPHWDASSEGLEDPSLLAHGYSQVVVIERAISEGRLLFMHYYSGGRGEFTQRRIKPLEISAEKYLIAFCYLRGEERVFRLSRIVALREIDSETGEVILPFGADQGSVLVGGLAPTSDARGQHILPIAASSDASKEDSSLRVSRSQLTVEAAFQYDEVDELGVVRTKVKQANAKEKSGQKSLFPSTE